MSKKIDFDKPYGEVFGAGEGHRYEQDGKRFDAEGNLIAEAKAAADDQADAPAPAAKKGSKKAAADDQVDAQLEG